MPTTAKATSACWTRPSTRPEREYAYDRESHVGVLDKALDQADANGWIIVDMKKDWKQVFPAK